jgi:U6 snRNA-associated Sm-like protein LSm8
VVTSDGRTIVGTLVGHDQVQNLILNDAVEHVYSLDQDVEHVPLGLYVVRGDNLCLVGEYDETVLSGQDGGRTAAPLPPIQQHQF